MIVWCESPAIVDYSVAESLSTVWLFFIEDSNNEMNGPQTFRAVFRAVLMVIFMAVFRVPVWNIKELYLW